MQTKLRKSAALHRLQPKMAARRRVLNLSMRQVIGSLRVYHQQAQEGFQNDAATISAGRMESGLKASLPIPKVGLARAGSDPDWKTVITVACAQAYPPALNAISLRFLPLSWACAITMKAASLRLKRLKIWEAKQWHHCQSEV